MIRGLYIGASGMVAESLRTDVISNNLANANTAGYKKDIAVNKDFASILISRVNDGANTPVIGSLGLGTVLDEIATVHASGTMRMTGNDFDMGIDGKGFFTVETPQGERYTRNGTFTQNVQGELITNEGYPVLGLNGSKIKIPQGKKLVVGSDGSLKVDDQTIGTMKIVEFADEKQLLKEGSSLYSVSPGPNGAATTGTTATGSVRQGYLEMSNVNIVAEMVNLITNYRAYEINGKVIQSHDQMIGKAVNDVGKI